MKLLMASLFVFAVFILFLATTSSQRDNEEGNFAGKKSDHYKDGVHNTQYDHEAFLGDAAKTFDQLSPEESVKRLRIIFHKIDSDSDGLISHVELKDWIRYTQKKYIRDNVDRSWKMHNPENKEELSWEEYSNIVYGFMKDLDPKVMDKEHEGTYKQLFERDRRRWYAADADENNLLTKDEFVAFLHPEETPHMRHLVVREALEDIDKDKDGKISLTEYIGDMYQGDDESEKPQWVVEEMEHFRKQRDKNSDGFLDESEVTDWIVPQGFDQAEAEASHLIYEADKNHDRSLSEEEVVEKYDLFVGSQATDFGEVLVRHDEF